MSCKVLLLSVHPEHSNNILNGSKLVELRRVRPKVKCGDTVIVYSSSPEKSIVGIVTVRKVIEKPLEQLWMEVEDKAKVSYEKFSSYFSGLSTGCGIFLYEGFRYSETSISLERLRKSWKNFHPPQSYRYLKEHEIELLDDIFDFDIRKVSNLYQESLLSCEAIN